jgi:hypothetical protein
MEGEVLDKCVQLWCFFHFVVGEEHQQRRGVPH